MCWTNPTAARAVAGIRCGPNDYLDQSHQLRVAKVNSAKSVRMLQTSGQFLNRDRGRVGCDDRLFEQRTQFASAQFALRLTSQRLTQSPSRNQKIDRNRWHIGPRPAMKPLDRFQSVSGLQFVRPRWLLDLCRRREFEPTIRRRSRFLQSIRPSSQHPRLPPS